MQTRLAPFIILELSEILLIVLQYKPKQQLKQKTFFFLQCKGAQQLSEKLHDSECLGFNIPCDI